MVQGLEPVHARHLHIQDDDIRVELLDPDEGALAVHGGATDLDAPRRVQGAAERAADDRGVIDDQDANG